MSKEQAAQMRGELVKLERQTRDLKQSFSDTNQRAAALAGQFGIVLPEAMRKTILQSQRAQTVVNSLFAVSQVAFFAGAIGGVLVPRLVDMFDLLSDSAEEMERIEASINNSVEALLRLPEGTKVQNQIQQLGEILRRMKLARDELIPSVAFAETPAGLGGPAQGASGEGGETCRPAVSAQGAWIRSHLLDRDSYFTIKGELH
jgi:hypothetical protein